MPLVVRHALLAIHPQCPLGDARRGAGEVGHLVEVLPRAVREEARREPHAAQKRAADGHDDPPGDVAVHLHKVHGGGRHQCAPVAPLHPEGRLREPGLGVHDGHLQRRGVAARLGARAGLERDPALGGQGGRAAEPPGRSGRAAGVTVVREAPRHHDVGDGGGRAVQEHFLLRHEPVVRHCLVADVPEASHIQIKEGVQIRIGPDQIQVHLLMQRKNDGLWHLLQHRDVTLDEDAVPSAAVEVEERQHPLAELVRDVFAPDKP
mmetsp:Transcript_77124/g.218570  ORF Transcript_77124/g.218570 Transcript_77124/m.218570 type:complete len:263 (-) Transcript_77124:1467-2255(-)